jgi:hydroxymethylpyrimidine kinase/phosphomethylpyrimidine kinase/thiamine-phosphate diphosphorylase
MQADPARRPVVWTIAGTDSGGGAGIQADTRALDAGGVHAACAVAAVTAQHSRAVERVEAVAPALLHAQLAALADDLPPAAIKTGLLGSVENLRVVVAWVKRLRALGRDVALVVDPVFGATTGARFADDALRAAYRDELLPLATLATPNRAEARALAPHLPAHDAPALARAWRGLGMRAVVVTGGDPEAADDAPAWSRDWLDADHGLPVRGALALPRLATPHHHGTGCVFAASAAAALAHGYVAADAVVLAKMATTEALRHAYAAGAGAGPVAPRAGFAHRLANLPRLAPTLAPPRDEAFAPLPAAARGLYAIVDDAGWVARVVAAGVKLVQLRIKDAPAERLVAQVRAAQAHARAAGAVLFVNDHWRIALELGCDGVHLGQEDLAGEVDLDALRRAGLRLGVSTHAWWEVCRARDLRPSYVACGPIHATQLKKMPWTPQGEANLAAWCRLLRDVPVVAIGGMDAARARAAAAAGAHAVAVVGAITRSDAPEAAIRALQAAIAEGTAQAPAPGGDPVDGLPPIAAPTLRAPA